MEGYASLSSNLRATAWLSTRRGHRAIGVVYHPDGDRYGNWVPTVMGGRYDALLSFERTDALHPLHLEAAQPSAEQERYIHWSVDKHLGQIGIYAPQFVINNFFDSWGHHFVYDAPTLAALLKSIGFTQITQHSPGQSDDPNLRNIESHGREIALDFLA